MAVQIKKLKILLLHFQKHAICANSDGAWLPLGTPNIVFLPDQLVWLAAIDVFTVVRRAVSGVKSKAVSAELFLHRSAVLKHVQSFADWFVDTKGLVVHAENAVFEAAHGP